MIITLYCRMFKQVLKLSFVENKQEACFRIAIFNLIPIFSWSVYFIFRLGLFSAQVIATIWRGK